ncbi:hypothetical protein SCLCIDRAFT_1223259 [Scleroderma citrinum Foug A]|uniref:Uncharacterized protein n=1 Tax=Scleroderma citrinum Foug A TaxID=1036808 RepID=A0A0C2ZJX5_9AGAM|nr:hypothetical protein SCLCIDRAFT_1223259 [Scleroderma citrinum Foug A]
MTWACIMILDESGAVSHSGVQTPLLGNCGMTVNRAWGCVWRFSTRAYARTRACVPGTKPCSRSHH